MRFEGFLGRVLRLSSSVSRLLMTVLVVCTSAAILITATRKSNPEFNMAMATAATGLATTLASVWALGKSRWSINADQSTRAKDEEAPK